MTEWYKDIVIYYEIFDTYFCDLLQIILAFNVIYNLFGIYKWYNIIKMQI